jgi:hypothetical protein
MKRRTQYPGRTELRLVPALTTRAAVSFGGILGARTRGAGPVGPGSGSSRGRGLDGPVPLFSLRRCLAEGGRKRNVGRIRVSGKQEP